MVEWVVLSYCTHNLLIMISITTILYLHTSVRRVPTLDHPYIIFSLTVWFLVLCFCFAFSRLLKIWTCSSYLDYAHTRLSCGGNFDHSYPLYKHCMHRYCICYMLHVFLHCVRYLKLSGEYFVVWIFIGLLYLNFK